MESTLIRVRAFLSDHYELVLVLAVGITLLGGGLTYVTYASPGPVETEERVVSSWTTSESFTHGATVEGDNSLYPVGTRLTNRTAYFTSFVDEIDGTHTYTYDASSGGDLTVESEARLVTRSVGERQHNGTVRDVEYWRTDRELNSVTVQSVAPGGHVEVPFTVDLNETDAHLTAVRKEVGSHGSVEVLVVVRTTINGTVNGNAVARTERQVLRLAPQGQLVRVFDPGTDSNRYEHTSPIAVKSDYGPIQKIGSVLLFVLPLVVLTSTTLAHATGRLAPTETERDVVTHRQARAEFDEWITPGRLPATMRSQPAVTVHTLEGLVDLAIDVDGRVIEDTDFGGYVVHHDGVLYVYRSPS